ncbi:unnamed protein product, partial [Pylaiella littoralis]
SDLFKPKPETVALSATEKYEMKKWGIDVDAILWPDGTSPPAWLKAVGNTTNKWANREMAITAAREEQEYVEKVTHRNKKSLIARPAPDYPSSSTTAPPPLPPWVKELPPVRDGRRQFATGVIIPSLDQHAYPPGGVAEVKRARRREKEAFLKTVFVTTARYERESGNRKKQGGYGGGACAGGAMRAAAVDGTDCGGAAGGAAADLPVPSGEGAVASDVYATDARNSPLAKPMSATKKTEEEEALLAGSPGDNARRISSGTGRVPVAEGPGRTRPQEEHTTGGASGKRGRDGGREESPSRNSETPTTSGLAAATGSENARSPTGVQRRGRLGGALGEQGGSGGGAAAAEPEERESRVATPAPVVTSSVRVLDMGVMRSS